MNETVQIKTPWLASKDPEVPSTLNYSTLSMCGRSRRWYVSTPITSPMNSWQNHHLRRDVAEDQRLCQEPEGHRHPEGDKVTICMPNAPQTLCMFYAVNMVGAIANMVHPLSAESEISFYLRDSNSVAAITLDQSTQV